MNKRLNVKLLAGLLFGSLFFCTGVYFLHGYQVRRSADGLLVRAAAAREEGDLRNAINLTARYLAYRDEDAEQYKQLAIDSKNYLYKMVEEDAEQIKRRTLNTAIFRMEEATRRNYADLELRRECIDLYLQLGSFKDAAAHLEEIDETLKTPEDKMQLILCQRRLGQEKAAERLLKQIIGYDEATGEFSVERAEHPELLDAYQTLAQMQITSGFDERGAEAVLNQMVAANPANYRAYLIRGEMLRLFRGEEAAEAARADVAKAAELAPDELDVMLVRANYLKEDGDFDEARELVEQGISKAPNKRSVGRLYKLLAEIAIQQKDIEGSFQILEEGLGKVPLDAQLLWTKAQLHVDRGEFDQVEKLKKRLADARGVTDAMIAYLDARKLISEGQYRDASKMLEKIRPHVDQQVKYQVDIFLNQCYAVLGQRDAQLASLQRLLEVTPQIVSLQISKLELLIAMGRNQEASRLLRALKEHFIVSGEPLDPRLQTAELNLKMRQLDARPTEERDFSEMDKLVKDILKRDDLDELQKLVMVTQLLFKKGQSERGIQYLERGIEKYPDQFALWAMRLEQARDAADAAAVLSRLERQFTDDRVALRVIRAKLAIRHDPDSAAQVIKKQEANADVFEPKLRAQLYRELGVLQLALGNRNEAVRLLELAHENSPRRLDILTTLYEIASKGTDADRLREMVDRIEAVMTRDDETWKMAEAGRLVWMVRNKLIDPSNITQARALMEQVRASRPEWVPVLLLESDVERLNGNLPAAIAALEKARQLQPSNAQIARMLAELYEKAGQISRAEELIARIPYSSRSSRDNRNQLLLLERQGDMAEAVKLVDVVIPETSDQPADQIWRSQILLKAGQLADAERAARKAISLQRGLPEAWVNLIRVLAVRKKSTEAEEALREADLLLPEQSKSLVMGQCYALIGDARKAQASFLNALRNDPRNLRAKRLLAELYLTRNHLDGAKPLLEQIVAESGAEEHVDDVHWARRVLARMLANTGSYADFVDALEMIERNAVDGELQGEDLKLWVGISTLRPEPASWKTAINRLERIEQERDLTDDELFMKAQLYEKYDDLWPEVKRMVVDVMSRNAGNTKLVETWVGWLLKRGELREAQIWKKNLDAQSVMRVRVELHALAQQGNHAQAAKKLTELVPQPPDTPEKMAQLIRVATLTEELGQYSEKYYQLAERQYALLVKQEPSQILRLAAVMGLHGDVAKIEKALQVCMAAKKYNIPSAQCAAIALSVLRAHPELWESALTDSIRKVSSWLDAELAAAPTDVALKARVAEFHDMMGNLDRVERAYEEILQTGSLSDRERGMILNNLAYVMALGGKQDRPMELIQEAIGLLGPTTDLLDTRGFIHLTRGDVDDAITDFRKAIDGGVKTGHKLFHLTLALDQKRATEEAASNWQEAVGLGLTPYKLPKGLEDEFRRLQATYGGS